MSQQAFGIRLALSSHMRLTRSNHPVIDLKANYGDRFRVKKNECGDQLICHKWGHFYSHSATELACFVKGNNKFNRIQKQFPEIRITQRGDEEIIFVFAPELFPAIAKALKASRKREISDAERKRLAHMGRAYRFGLGNHGYKERNLEKSADFSLPECIGIGTRQE